MTAGPRPSAPRASGRTSAHTTRTRWSVARPDSKPLTPGSPRCSAGNPTERLTWRARGTTGRPGPFRRCLPASSRRAGRRGREGAGLAARRGLARLVAADSTEEAFAFVAATLLGLPEEERTALLSAVLVVRTRAAWDEVLARAGTDGKLVLIPVFEGPESAEAIASRAPRCRVGGQQHGHRRHGHHASPAGARRQPARGVWRPPVHRAAGRRTGTGGARSLLMLRQRRLAASGVRPQWAQPAQRR